MAELNQYFNEALKGNYKKALKKVERVEVAANNKQAQEFKSYIKAYCYKCKDELENYEEERSAINDEDYLSKLESME
ncbi:hypothetical protein [Mangrovivirga cuniculi]|uniref:Uncharacterized protein n=1 Tax=Mangrovivirga cuniculi TaxID=2715131 RepID=A0A4D7JAP9_9BACT|nr:hypothetical protein [Mangrovivirga cuniculi]QCK13499.1 hypothetical protein DCC35_01380 [Mangrovivirga cuniculi]